MASGWPLSSRAITTVTSDRATNAETTLNRAWRSRSGGELRWRRTPGDAARGAPCVADHVTLDTRSRRSLQVGSGCLATAPAYVVRIVCGKQQDASEEPLRGRRQNERSPKYSPSACPADVSNRATYSLGVRTRRTLNATTRRGRRIEAATSRTTDRRQSRLRSAAASSLDKPWTAVSGPTVDSAAMLPPRGPASVARLGALRRAALVGDDLTRQRGVGAAAFALLELLHKVQRLRSLAGGRVCGAGLSADARRSTGLPGSDSGLSARAHPRPVCHAHAPMKRHRPVRHRLAIGAVGIPLAATERGGSSSSASSGRSRWSSLQVAAQAIDFAVSTLEIRGINSDTHRSLFGIASLLAQTAVATACLWRGSRIGRERGQ